MKELRLPLDFHQPFLQLIRFILWFNKRVDGGLMWYVYVYWGGRTHTCRQAYLPPLFNIWVTGPGNPNSISKLSATWVQLECNLSATWVQLKCNFGIPANYHNSMKGHNHAESNLFRSPNRLLHTYILFRSLFWFQIYIVFYKIKFDISCCESIAFLEKLHSKLFSTYCVKFDCKIVLF